MAFGGFKETSETEETNENKESSLDNTDKRRNQILETPDDYDDDFDSKLDSNEDDNKENSSESQDSGEEKQGLFDRIKGFFSKDKPEDSKETSETTEEPEKVGLKILEILLKLLAQKKARNITKNMVMQTALLNVLKVVSKENEVEKTHVGMTAMIQMRMKMIQMMRKITNIAERRGFYGSYYNINIQPIYSTI